MAFVVDLYRIHFHFRGMKLLQIADFHIFRIFILWIFAFLTTSATEEGTTFSDLEHPTVWGPRTNRLTLSKLPISMLALRSNPVTEHPWPYKCFLSSARISLAWINAASSSVQELPAVFSQRWIIKVIVQRSPFCSLCCHTLWSAASPDSLNFHCHEWLPISENRKV